MSDAPLSAEDLAALRELDTPTVCNALELLVPDARLRGFTHEGFVTAHPDLPPVVGYARTATIRAMQAPSRAGAELKAQRLAYYSHIETGPAPAVPVIQDLDPVPGFGAFWGEVNSNVHKALGCPGAITNGSIRDLDMIAEGFNLLGGKVGPSHAWVHVVDFGTDVNILGMAVRNGDLVHADRHGAVVIPHKIARDVVGAAELIGRREAVTLEACKRPGFSVEVLRQAMGEAEDIH